MEIWAEQKEPPNRFFSFPPYKVYTHYCCCDLSVLPLVGLFLEHQPVIFTSRHTSWKDW